MTLTHEELLRAVREAGRDRESFTCADVRQCLGISTKDRKQLSRFHSRFRVFQVEASAEIERLGNNRYRLRKAAAKRVSGKRAAEVASPRPSARTHRPLRASTPVASDTLAAPKPAARAAVPATRALSDVDAAALAALSPEDETLELTEDMLEFVSDRSTTPPLPPGAQDVLAESLKLARTESPDASCASEPASGELEITAGSGHVPGVSAGLSATADTQESSAVVPVHAHEATPESVSSGEQSREPAAHGVEERAIIALGAADEVEEVSVASNEFNLPVAVATQDDDAQADVAARANTDDIEAHVDGEGPAVRDVEPVSSPRTWRDRGQWLSRRFVEIFSRA